MKERIMKQLIPGIFFILLVSVFSCEQQSSVNESMAFPDFDIEGHRGCRGYYPENTVQGFIRALKMGVTTLEMDVVVTGDQELLLSHEPWMSGTLCQMIGGDSLIGDEMRNYNIYNMSYDEIVAYDCGSKTLEAFPDQEKVVVTKPLLKDVIDSVEIFCEKYQLKQPWYNIETKSRPEGDGIFHPEPGTFIDSLVSVITKKGIASRTIIQSFDVRTIQVAREKYPNIKVALLVEKELGPEIYLDSLGFVPDIYSCNWTLVDKGLIAFAKEKNMKVVPWTVNEVESIQTLMEMGVDGIISDYPDRVVELLKRE